MTFFERIRKLVAAARGAPRRAIARRSFIRADAEGFEVRVLDKHLEWQCLSRVAWMAIEAVVVSGLPGFAADEWELTISTNGAPVTLDGSLPGFEEWVTAALERTGIDVLANLPRPGETVTLRPRR